MATSNMGGRAYTVTVADNGNFLDAGPAATSSSVGTFVFQFHPSLDFAGSIQVFGRVFGTAAQSGNVAAVPIPYRRVSLGGLASDYALVSDPITTAAIIQVPSNGLAVEFLVACTAGTCGIYGWPLQGPSSI